MIGHDLEEGNFVIFQIHTFCDQHIFCFLYDDDSSLYCIANIFVICYALFDFHPGHGSFLINLKVFIEKNEVFGELEPHRSISSYASCWVTQVLFFFHHLFPFILGTFFI